MNFTEAQTKISDSIDKMDNVLQTIGDNLSLAVIDRVNNGKNLKATMSDMLNVISEDLPEEYQIKVLTYVIYNLAKSGDFSGAINKNRYNKDNGRKTNSSDYGSFSDFLNDSRRN